MKLSIFQVDAFTPRLFGGNPAAVVPIEGDWPTDDILQNIAIENNLAETAFFRKKEERYHLRWFTPEFEIDLCGHATLASAHVIFQELDYPGSEIRFDSMSGELIVKKVDEKLQLDFPSRMPEPAEMNEVFLQAFSNRPQEIMKSRDYFLIYESEDDIRNLKVDPSLLSAPHFNKGGIICTAKGDSVDFVSRFFLPGASVFEDPVTGSAHCSLIPYWAARLKKKEMIAQQLSQRKGELYCQDEGARVFISGQAVTYLKGEIEV